MGYELEWKGKDLKERLDKKKRWLGLKHVRWKSILIKYDSQINGSDKFYSIYSLE
jgi:hypothetical protein